eukprot:CAMPEP_0203936888 /NCGR_PEP_ID=MMETSP0359-20131031/74296_1 /ASSEMBLY_ACC=CAM_ASM_000338 /TAXON_ID=268821 /ORGANISM="Scrippsiella Hangoei, Strain SHTV-5" /LENGTH=30 /DNA_ID= /DNA_START= /DNA_END= /DNA_ORIENTATION=
MTKMSRRGAAVCPLTLATNDLTFGSALLDP